MKRIPLIALFFSVFASLSIVPKARADPSAEKGGLDSPETRAKVLEEAMEQFVRGKQYDKAFDAASAAHRLVPTFRMACVSASLAQKLQYDVEAAERFSECIRRAVAAGYKQWNPAHWEVIQADFEAAMNRVGVMRVKAPPLTRVTIDDKDEGFAENSRDIFLEAKISHKVVATSVLGAVHEENVRLDRGEHRDLFLTFEIPAPAPEPETTVPAAPRSKPAPAAPAPLQAKENALPSAFWIALGASLAFGGAAAFTGGKASTLAEIADADFNRIPGYSEHHCKGRSDEPCVRAQERATSATVFTGITLGLSGLALLSGGTAFGLYLTRDSTPASHPQMRSLPPFAGSFSLTTHW